ncbi:MAG: DotI/IcmL family type IV secretion protein [Bdellovibrionales bacterium]
MLSEIVYEPWELAFFLTRAGLTLFVLLFVLTFGARAAFNKSLSPGKRILWVAGQICFPVLASIIYAILHEGRRALKYPFYILLLFWIPTLAVSFDPFGIVIRMENKDSSPFAYVDNNVTLFKQDVLDWGVKAAKDIMTFDYANYVQEQRRARVYFTGDGWHNYWEMLRLTKLDKDIHEGKLSSELRLRQAPSFEHFVDTSHEDEWIIQIPVKILYTPQDEPENAFESKGYLNMSIHKIQVDYGHYGLGIDQMIVSPLKLKWTPKE